MVPHNLPTSLLTALETFDGSGVDPVVVSNTFWSSLGSKFVSLLIGQVLATIVFTIVVSIAASQMSGVVDRFTTGVVEKILGPPPKKLRMPPPNDGASSAIDLQKLAICIAIDVLGASSELIPVVGELTDVVYAPLAATLLRSLYGSNVVFLLEFGDEILPFTDIIPIATICWVVDTLAPSSGLARLLQLGDYGNSGVANNGTDVVDTSARTLASDKKGEERPWW